MTGTFNSWNCQNILFFLYVGLAFGFVTEPLSAVPGNNEGPVV